VVLLDVSLEETTDDSFCLSCHEMAENIAGEFERDLILPGSGERHASCSDCHLPQGRVPRLLRKLRAGRELYHHLVGTLATAERFDERRMAMAHAVWRDLERNESDACTRCHGDLAGQGTQSTLAGSYHARAEANGVGCADCHKGIAHALAPQAGDTRHGDAAACVDCHEPEWVESVWQASHSDPMAARNGPVSPQCGDCHVAASVHEQFPLDGKGLRGAAGRGAIASESRACSECHREGPTVTWDVRAHWLSEAACRSCHRLHPGEGSTLASAVQAATPNEMCTESCHVWAESNGGTAAAAAPDRQCMNCHNPHLPPDSDRCASCHPMTGPTLAEQSARARGFHERAEREKHECGECHQGIIHESSHAELMEIIPKSL
jgi:nitrate/TMAO reductase-like tetraheme cytochrome c subunit